MKKEGENNMCGRYQLNVKLESILFRYDIPKTVLSFYPKTEVFPSNEAPVILREDNKKFKMLKWGFKPSFTNKLLINARSESVDIKSSFKDAFKTKRCLIPANSFFEWKNVDGEKVKYKISLRNKDIFSMAGIYNSFINKAGERFDSFVILTTSSNEAMKDIHSRMPVIIDKNNEDIWLDNSIQDLAKLKKLLKPWEKGLVLNRQDSEQLKLF
ncbi:SOS response-associated peptidase [Dethiothermospora halolimnae]|uniref:SOS response-associated peptidase n=1 Tax=Dethiothermospora halolimnae TaxID=3114390 RepID=UPI003CCB869D